MDLDGLCLAAHCSENSIRRTPREIINQLLWGKSTDVVTSRFMQNFFYPAELHPSMRLTVIMAHNTGVPLIFTSCWAISRTSLLLCIFLYSPGQRMYFYRKKIVPVWSRSQHSVDLFEGAVKGHWCILVLWAINNWRYRPEERCLNLILALTVPEASVVQRGFIASFRSAAKCSDSVWVTFIWKTKGWKMNSWFDWFGNPF